MVTSKKGRELHSKAEVAKESGQFQQALEYCDQATIAYSEDGDLLGLAEIQSSRFATFKHLYQATKKPEFLVLAKHAVLSSVEVAKMSGVSESLAIPYHNLGKYYSEAGEYKEAAKAFKMAVEYIKSSPPERHNRPAVIADFVGHQFAAEYLTGDKSAIGQAEEALRDLEESVELSRYNKDVWLSGAHLRLAKMLKSDNPEKAKLHLMEAKKIIDSNSDLVLRKQQLLEIESEFDLV
ncbi:hypothetical protein A3H85_02120 [Candidatus Daviesbacteria bacterium RIFCSPLOWO2_02_FULL_40_8]|uniref:Uncharacterized protein n=1 Tax=Candidatus Daviesbacteria bacterium RIFCSPLOWO2_01_FULL_40_24 TaxID=1797787 RepID=A0A1F5MJP4_9BACT|nr:MAG: hypothetical protein A2780_02855 [Candidatus Daviesbacteria bacterium RIFCSPHIGHO2_01_FULL_41_45]OGE35478.1 MAG: hypothetical protein A3C32_03430 [Candidatus Daviesbacteria bacterium RIFCSPHIGHO2_02_FULL_41_14]OGE65568.1 MAG: hypothetical protein A3B49_02010 [Candidatus Daviesbacteria bacterium RIFCSPLOWO2_01_FULL_40_24]OGE67144.1 MAG: hypothetical protein A3H85_02120 [Candidatus Daviesbacteria bacterium RIFCSPLOWO2_02_FULL_40_8]